MLEQTLTNNEKVRLNPQYPVIAGIDLNAVPRLIKTDENGYLILSPQSAQGMYFDFTIDAMRGTPHAIEAILTTQLQVVATGRQAIMVIGGIRSYSVWQLLAGTADPTDPEGQVAPLDYNVSTNAKFWQKTL